MRIVIVIGLIALLLLLLYRRLRPYLKAGKHFAETVRDLYRVTGTPRTSNRTERLVRCENCNTWIPSGRALRTNSSIYCSRPCLEASTASKRRKTAS